MKKASSLRRMREHLVYSCLECFVTGDGIELKVMSECLAKQEHLVTFMLHVNSFPLCQFPTVSPTYAQVQRTPHM